MGVKRHKPKPYIFSFELVMSEIFPFSGFYSTAALDLGMLKCSKQFKNSFILSIKFNTLCRLIFYNCLGKKIFY